MASHQIRLHGDDSSSQRRRFSEAFAETRKMEDSWASFQNCGSRINGVWQWKQGIVWKIFKRLLHWRERGKARLQPTHKAHRISRLTPPLLLAQPPFYKPHTTQSVQRRANAWNISFWNSLVLQYSRFPFLFFLIIRTNKYIQNKSIYF